MRQILVLNSCLGLSAAVLLLISTSSASIGQVDNVITRWNAVAQQAVRSQSIPNHIAARFFAFIHLSQYKALQLAFKKGVDHPEAAAAYAAHYVLSELFPWQQSAIFDSFLAVEIRPLHLSSRQDVQIRNIATSFASTLLCSRVLDGSQKWVNFEPAPSGGPPGHYQFTPNQTYVVYPQLKDVKPLLTKPVESYDVFGGSPSVPSALYDSNYEIVARDGDTSAPTHTKEETETAWFWEDPAGTAQLAGHLFNVSLAAIGRSLSLKETAHLFATLAVANYEANIAAWYQKFKYLFWRPVTAFHQGDPSHPARPSFQSAIAVPAHPEYPSGHASSAGAYAAVLSNFLHMAPNASSPAGPFIVTSESPHNVPPRTFHTIDGPALDIAQSRIYGGVHFPTSTKVGYQLGLAVGNYDAENFERVYGTL